MWDMVCACVVSQPQDVNGQLQQARRKQNCVGPAYWYLYPSVYVSVYAETRWVWGHAPSGKFLILNAMRWLLRLFWGPKHHYYSLLLS